MLVVREVESVTISLSGSVSWPGDVRQILTAAHTNISPHLKTKSIYNSLH